MRKNELKNKAPKLHFIFDFWKRCSSISPVFHHNFGCGMVFTWLCTGLEWACLQQAFGLEQQNFDTSSQLSPVASYWCESLRGFGMCKLNSFQRKLNWKPLSKYPQWFPEVKFICSRNSGGSKQFQLAAEVSVNTVVNRKREEITGQEWCVRGQLLLNAFGRMCVFFLGNFTGSSLSLVHV